MARKISLLSPPSARLLRRFGERLRLLRVRHRLSAKQMAAATGMSVMTLRSLERGGEGVTIGAYLAVMGVLGIERDLDELAAAAFLSEVDEPELAARESRPRLAGDTDAPTAGPIADERLSPGIEPAVVIESAVVIELAAVIESAAAIESAAMDGEPSGGGASDSPPGTAAAPMPDRRGSGEPGFEWLDAPARDLRQLLQLDAGGVVPEEEDEESGEGPTPDLFEVAAEREAPQN